MKNFIVNFFNLGILGIFFAAGGMQQNNVVRPLSINLHTVYDGEFKLGTITAFAGAIKDKLEIGSLGIGSNRGSHKSKVACIFYHKVDKNFRNLTVGTNLMLQAIAVAREYNYEIIKFSVVSRKLEKLERLKKFYGKFGAHVIEERIINEHTNFAMSVADMAIDLKTNH